MPHQDTTPGGYAMSRAAQDYLTANLPEITRAVYVDEQGTRRALGENGLRLVVWLAGVTNKRGEVFYTVAAMAEETGLTPRVVTRLLAGFEGLGWLTRTGREVVYNGRGRPTPVYALTLVPDLWTGDAENDDQLPTNGRLTAHLGSRKTTNANTGNGSRDLGGLELEPEPEPETPQAPRKGQGQQRGKDQGGKGLESDLFTAVLARALEIEHDDYAATSIKPVGAGLRRSWQRDLTPQVAQIVGMAPETRPDDDKAVTTLAREAVDARRYANGLAALPQPETPKAPTPAPPPMPTIKRRGADDCRKCHGTGQVARPMDNGAGYNTRQCECVSQVRGVA